MGIVKVAKKVIQVISFLIEGFKVEMQIVIIIVKIWPC